MAALSCSKFQSLEQFSLDPARVETYALLGRYTVNAVGPYVKTFYLL